MIKLSKKMVVKGIVFLATSLILTTVFTSFAPTQQEAIIFLGQPTHKVSEGGIERTPEKLSKEKASQFLCVIVKKGDKYYWKSRENKELVKMDSGAFTYFIAPTSGYVKFIKPALKSAASLMSPTEAKFGYIEHLSIGLRSVNYWGDCNYYE
jgi:hypothetical protein|tara:strand:+ start:238 stop:693 length:456 start_codon:yes stop_codon:yes gene_type:complete